jgi:hypothetical protein
MKAKIISREKLLSKNPCYDPIKLGMVDSGEIDIVQFLIKSFPNQKNTFDWVWLINSNEYLSESEMNDFNNWCLSDAEKIVGENNILLDVVYRYRNKNTENASFLLSVHVRYCSKAIFNVTKENFSSISKRYMDKVIEYL